MRNNIYRPTTEPLTSVYHSTCLGKSDNEFSILHGHETQQRNFYLTCLRTHTLKYSKDIRYVLLNSIYVK